MDELRISFRNCILAIWNQLTRKGAWRAAEAMGKKHGVHFSVYKCAWCDGWHIGKNAQNKITNSEVVPDTN